MRGDGECTLQNAAWPDAKLRKGLTQSCCSPLCVRLERCERQDVCWQYARKRKEEPALAYTIAY